jgi:hypothetical protein
VHNLAIARHYTAFSFLHAKKNDLHVGTGPRRYAYPDESALKSEMLSMT